MHVKPSEIKISYQAHTHLQHSKPATAAYKTSAIAAKRPAASMITPYSAPIVIAALAFVALGLVVADPVGEPVVAGPAEELAVVVVAGAALAVALPQTKVTLHCCWPARSPAFIFMQSPLAALQIKDGIVLA